MVKDPPQLPGETRKSYANFLNYLHLPAHERSMAAMSRKFGKTSFNYQQQSRKYNWQERAKQYDAALSNADAEILQKARTEAATNRALREVTRQNECWDLAQRMTQRIREILEVEPTEIKEDHLPDGTVRRKRIAKNTGMYVGLSMLTREAARLYQLAIMDNLAPKVVDAPENPVRGQLVPGGFRLWQESNLPEKEGDPASTAGDPMDRVIEVQPVKANGHALQ